MAAAAAVESTGTRRAVIKSEKFMEWQRELSSSRATYGGRKRHDEPDSMEANTVKKALVKSWHFSEDHGVKLQPQQSLEESLAEIKEPVAELVAAGEGTVAIQRTKAKKQQHQRQRTDAKKIRKEHEVELKEHKRVNSQSKDCPTTVETEGGRMHRCKQQVSSQGAFTKHQSNSHSPTQARPQQSQEGCHNQPICKRRQQRLPRSFTPPKEEAEKGSRTLTRNRGGETPPPPPVIPTTKGGTKRSRRVAQRLANEEPPPPPLKLPKLHLLLTRKEIQEDWLKITGHKYTGKPKKSTLNSWGLGLCTSLMCPSSIKYLNEPQWVLAF